MRSHDHECEWVRDHIDALVDDDAGTPPAERAHVERHVAACEACARELALARRVRTELRALAFPAAPADVVARAEAHIAAKPARVVPLRARRPLLKRVALAAAAAVLIVAAVAVLQERRRATDQVAVEQAARDAAIAFAYVGKYTRRAGEIVESEVIEQRLLAPVGKAMGKSGVTETKANDGQS